mgnify:CR=1 FL=1
MKLILITPPTYFVEEDKIITALFEKYDKKYLIFL